MKSNIIHPIKFPNHYDVIREDAEQFQKLELRSTARIMSEMIQAGFELMAISPHKDQNQEIMEGCENQGHLAHSRLFARFGVNDAPTSFAVK